MAGPFGVRVTGKALKNLHKPIRLSVKPLGCGGYSYKFEAAEQLRADDFLLHRNLCIDKDSMSFMSHDLVIDYKDTDFKKGFIVINPSEVSRCGCGESFTI